MAFKHGKDAAISVDSVLLSAYCDALSLNAEKDTAETTTFGDDWKEHLAGLRGATLDIGGNYDPTATTGPAEKLWAVFNADAAVTFIYYPGGNVSGQKSYTFDGHITAYAESAPVGDKVTFTSSVLVTGAVVQAEVS